MEDVKKWVKNPNRKYDEGVLLYAKYGRNRNLLKTLSGKVSDWNSKKLLSELSKIAELPEDSYTLPKPLKVVINGEEKELPKQTLTSAQTDALSQLLQNTIATRAKLSNRLKDCTIDAERKTIVDEIKPLTEKIAEVRKSLREGKPLEVQTPAVVAPSVQDPLAIARSLGNAKSNLSKWRGKLNSAQKGSKGFNKAQNKVNDFEEQVRDLTAKLAIGSPEVYTS